MKPINLTEREIDAKVDEAVRAEIAKGKKASDMGRQEHLSIARAAHAKMSPAARKQAAIDGLTHIACFVLGGIIAESIWQSGKGWPADEQAALGAYRSATFRGMPLRLSSDAEAMQCLGVFREELPELTRKEFDDRCDPVLVERFGAMFDGQQKRATIGEIATKKAMLGDPLAMSFLSWMPA